MTDTGIPTVSVVAFGAVPVVAVRVTVYVPSDKPGHSKDVVRVIAVLVSNVFHGDCGITSTSTNSEHCSNGTLHVVVRRVVGVCGIVSSNSRSALVDTWSDEIAYV